MMANKTEPADPQRYLAVEVPSPDRRRDRWLHREAMAPRQLLDLGEVDDRHVLQGEARHHRVHLVHPFGGFASQPRLEHLLARLAAHGSGAAAHVDVALDVLPAGVLLVQLHALGQAVLEVFGDHHVRPLRTTVSSSSWRPVLESPTARSSRPPSETAPRG